jgi:DnaJ-class molecular chaperone
MAKRDYYEVLGVDRNADEKKIKQAYRKLAREHHPDVNKAPDAAVKFREATEAYEVLSDPQKRKMYDQFGHAGPQGGFGGAGGQRPGGGRSYTWTGGRGAPGGVDFDFGDMFGGAARGGGRSGFMGMSLEEIMEALRGGGSGARRSTRTARRARGQDMEYHVHLDFLQAARGSTITLKVRHNGGADEAETINVKVPPGVHEGSKVRVRGKGGKGPAGAGDLYIITHIRAHPYFRREGRDIYVDVPISLTEAALGGKVDVPTIDGMTTVTVPPGSGGGRKLRLREKGIHAPGGKKRGDQYVVLRVTPPESLSDEAAGKLREFAELQPYDPREKAPWK